MTKTPKTFLEPARIPRGVSTGQPNDFRVGVGESAFGRLPNQVWNGRGFVINNENAPAFVVKTGEGLYLVLRPRNSVNAPGLRMGLIARIKRRGGEGEHWNEQRRQAIPF